MENGVLKKTLIFIRPYTVPEKGLGDLDSQLKLQLIPGDTGGRGEMAFLRAHSGSNPDSSKKSMIFKVVPCLLLSIKSTDR